MERLHVKSFWWLHLFWKPNQSGGQELHWYKSLDRLNTLQKIKASKKLSNFFNSQQTLHLQETTSKMHQIAIFSVSAI